MKTYDLVVIGSGPGGYVAALYASRHNLSVCVIEKDMVGGTCLNRGCIPTKTLINSAALLSTIKNAALFGIDVDGVKFDYRRILSRKDQVVERLRSGIETLFRARSVDLVRGTARFSSDGSVDVEGYGAVKGSSVIVAAGSRPSNLPNIKIDDDLVLSSEGILRIGSLPESIAIVGGGVIGCEFASLFSRLGSKVTIIEMMDRLLAGQSPEASKKLETIFRKSGIDIRTSAKVEKIDARQMQVIGLSHGGTVEAQRVLVSVGRVPATSDLGLERAGIELKNGRVLVDKSLRTTRDHVYAIGDCVDGPQLAHKASYDAILACDNILGRNRQADYSVIPSCIWTDPEIASVGLPEDEAKARHPSVRVAKFPYLASGKAYIEAKTEGFVKIIGDESGRLLGVEIMGALACELIGEAVLAISQKMTVEEWGAVVHGHPTISETLQEASHVFCKHAIHTP